MRMMTMKRMTPKLHCHTVYVRPKRLSLFPETRPTLAFTPDPINFMDLFVPKFFGLNFHRTVVYLVYWNFVVS